MLFRQMEYFQAVVENNNFSVAAEKCHVSQSAISQQIKKLEDELGVELLDRHNRTFSLTPAGEYFYRKSTFICNDIEKLIVETKKFKSDDNYIIRLGCYSGYNGDEFSSAISLFSEKHPKINIQVMTGSHEELYNAMERGTIDFALNDQRRAFSGTYNNLILSESRTFIEISSQSTLSYLKQVEIEKLKDIPCILVVNSENKQEEKNYYSTIVGIHSNFLFADSLQEAKLMIISGQGYMPVDVIDATKKTEFSIKRIPLMRNNEPITKTYCAFWKKDNSGYYIEDFADILKSEFI